MDHECNSDDEDLGEFASLEECKNACRNMPGCHFFIFGKESKQGWCYWEKTAAASSCPEGYEEDEYDFHELTSKFNFYHFYFWLLNALFSLKF